MKSNGKITKIYNLRGKLNFPIPEDGIDTSDATAVVEDIKQGKTVYARGQKLTGTMPNRGSVTISPNTVSQEHDSGYYDSIKVNAVTNEIDTNIKSENIKDGISILGVEGNLVELNGQTITVAPSTIEKVINPEEGYNGITQVTVEAVTNNIDTNIKQENIKKDVSILGITGTLEEGVDTSDADAVETDILSGKTAYVDGNKITGTITSKEAQTYIPSSSEQIIDAGQYLSGAQTISAVPTEEKTITPSALSQEITPTENKFLSKVTVSGDADLTAENIKSGVTIFGVEGSYTSDANAMAEDIAMNKTAYINGQKITGTLPLFPNSRTFTVDNAGVADNTEDSELEFTTINTAKQILDSNLNMKFSSSYSDIVTAIGLTADKLISGNTILGIEGMATTGINTSDATATPDDIVVNKTAYANGQKITGTIPTATTITEDGSVQLESDGRFRASATVPNDIYLHSDITPRMIWLNLTKSQVAETIGLTADKIVSGNTILDVAGTAPITGTDTSDATASANDIRFGESAYVNGEKIEGSLSTIFNLGYQVDSVVWTDETEQNQLKLDIPVNNSGIINAGSSKIAVILRYDKLAEEIGLTAEKIKAGETILGITGTYTGDVESV